MDYLSALLLLYQQIFVLAQSNLISQPPLHPTWPVLTNQVSDFVRSNYKFSLHIRAEAPNKKLIYIQPEITQLARDVLKSNLWRDGGVVWTRIPFHLTHLLCSWYVSYIIIVIAAWYGYSKYFKTNVCKMKEWTVLSRGFIKNSLIETVAYVFTDIPFLDSHSLLFNGYY